MEKQKNYREFKQYWNNDKITKDRREDQIENFCHLCNEMYMALRLIKLYDEELFNKYSTHSIDDYIEVFDNLYGEFFKEVFENEYDTSPSSFRFYYKGLKLKKDKFILVEKSEYDLMTSFSKDKDVTIGIKDEYYQTIKSKVNPILIFERELKHITMQDIFWSKFNNNPDEININGQFTICVKVLVDGGWRCDENKQSVKKFSNDRIYQSASIINERKKDKLFKAGYYGYRQCALLVYKFDLSKVCCLCNYDAYSDEYINGETKYMEITQHTSIQKIDEELVGEDMHELFSYSPVFGTLNSLLHLCYEMEYNEVVLKNPEPIAVLAIDCKSIGYAMKIAEQHNVKYLGLLPISQMYYEEITHSEK